MARGRFISKSLSTSEKFASLVVRQPTSYEFHHALYMLLVVHSDDYGRLQGDAYTVKLACYPASSRSLEEFADALKGLDEVHLITWYDAGGKRFIQIIDFDEHQQGLHKRTRSRFPEQNGHMSSGNGPEPPGNSGTLPEIPGNSGKFPVKRREVKGSEGKKDKERAPTGRATVADPSAVRTQDQRRRSAPVAAGRRTAPTVGRPKLSPEHEALLKKHGFGALSK